MKDPRFYLIFIAALMLMSVINRRDSCANPSYAQYMGPEICKVSK